MVTDVDTIARARAVLFKMQDDALAASPLAGMPEWLASGHPPPAEELRRTGFRNADASFLKAALVRSAFRRHWGYSIPCAEAVKALGKLGPIVEVGAGTGYWTAILSAAGYDVIATDPNPRGDIGHGFTAGMHWAVEAATGLEAIDRYPRAVFCSWPTKEDEWAAEMASKLTSGRALALIIEPKGGLTGSPALFDILEANFRLLEQVVIPQFPDTRDALFVFERR